MRLRHGRIAREDASEPCDALVDMAGVGQSQREIELADEKVGSQGDRAPPRRQSLRQFALLAQDGAESGERLDVVRVRRQNLTQRRRGPFQISAIEQHRPEIAQNDRRGRLDRERPVAGRLRLVETSQLFEDDAEVAERRRVTAIVKVSPPVAVDRLVEAAFVVQGEAEAVMGLGVIGLKGERSRIMRARLAVRARCLKPNPRRKGVLGRGRGMRLASDFLGAPAQTAIHEGPRNSNRRTGPVSP